MILPQSLVSALFPAAAAVQPRTDEARQVLSQSIRLLFLVMFPLVLAMMVLARPGFSAWLGEEFAVHASPVLQLLALGVLLNAIAQGPATLIQSAGRPRTMALLHLIELPVFLVLLYILTLRYGIVGTAAAAALRSGFDAVAVLMIAQHQMLSGRFSVMAAAPSTTLAIALLLAALWPSTMIEALIVLALSLLTFFAFSWRWLLLPQERQRVQHVFGVAS